MSAVDDAQAMAEARRRGFEARDVPPRGVVLAVAGLFAGLVLALAFVAALLALLTSGRPTAPARAFPRQTQAPAVPRLQVDPVVERRAIEAAAREKLEGYAWTDRARGEVRVPIAKAMAMRAARGWPDDAEREGSPQP